MADLLLSAVLPILIQKATDLVIGEFRATRGVEKDCQKLCRILPAVQAVVDDAEKRCGAEPGVRGWVHCLKAAACEAEDVLDELKYDAIAEVVQTEIQAAERKALHCLPRCFLFKNGVFKSCSTAKRLKGILEKIDTLVAEMNKFGFLKTLQPMPSVVDQPRSQSYVVGSTVIGRSDDLENIVATVMSQAERERIAVLPIVGMGGLGKTTLAQLVYNSERIQKHFDLKLWVCVSHEFHVNHLAKSIIDLAIQKDSMLPLDNKELISQRLRAELGGKRYLPVLDDVWNEISNKWEDLKRLLDCGSPGSVVIITTRSGKVGLIVHTTHAYNLHGLNENDLWGIFKEKAFQMDVDERPELIEIGKRLMKKCCGSPLVATSLGGLMSYKKEESEWLDVLENDNSIVEDEVMSVLKLSYESLPSYMKRCFVFCAVYPKDFLIERDTLIQLWMTNSYIPSEGNVDMETKGIEIFNELAWRGFFQDFTQTLKGDIACKMHDLIHDLAKSLVGNACVSLSDLVQQSDILSKETFHVSYLNRQCIYGLFDECSFVHTILSFLDGFIHRNEGVVDLSKVKLCRALSFRKICLEIHVEPRTLKHLRYLELTYCDLRVLPESLCTSYNLQTLKLDNCQSLIRLPEGMRHMRSLRHVYLRNCHKLECMPAYLGKLSCLQTLTMYIVYPEIGCGIEELKDLNLGGQLALYGIEKIGNKKEAKLANLISKKRLIYLELYWGEGSSVDSDTARDVLEGLEPCRVLKILDIYNYKGIQFAAWMHSSTTLRNLTELRLVNCILCTVLWPIWQLPSLKELELWRLESLKHICSGSALLAQRQNGDSRVLPMFPKLQVLLLQRLKNLENWQEDDPAERTSLCFPQLRQLKLIDCPKLAALPYCPLLTYLNLDKLNSVKHICCSGSTKLDKSNGMALPIFLKLENLWLNNMPSLERWQESDITESTSLALPQLCDLTITKCPQLDALPSCHSLSSLTLSEVGLKYICSGQSALLEPIFPMLQTLYLAYMSSLERWHKNDPAEETSLALQQLRDLTILECPMLDALPSCPLLIKLRMKGSNIPSSVIESFKKNGVEVEM